MSQETAKVVIEEIKKNPSTITKIIHTESTEDKKKDQKFEASPEDTFVEIDEDTKVNTNIDRIGTVKKEKTKISDSLNKMNIITTKAKLNGK